MKRAENTSNIEESLSFFKSLQFRNFTSQDDFMFTVVPEFAKVLGYNEDVLFYEVNIGNKKPLIADAVIKQNAEAEPDIVVEIKYPGNAAALSYKNQVEKLARLSGARLIVTISPVALSVYSEEKWLTFSFASLDSASLMEIQKLHSNMSTAAVKKQAAF